MKFLNRLSLLSHKLVINRAWLAPYQGKEYCVRVWRNTDQTHDSMAVCLYSLDTEEGLLQRMAADEALVEVKASKDLRELTAPGGFRRIPKELPKVLEWAENHIIPPVSRFMAELEAVSCL